MAENENGQQKQSILEKLDLSDEDRSQLISELIPEIKDQILKDLRTAEPQQQIIEQVASAIDSSTGDLVVTNISQGDLMFHDLGTLAGNGNFIPEVLKRGQVINLSEIYSEKELRAARSIKRMLSADPPLLALGAVTVPQYINEHSRRAAEQPEGSFVVPGENEYDKKLKELEEKEHQEDLRTRKGYQGA